MSHEILIEVNEDENEENTLESFADTDGIHEKHGPAVENAVEHAVGAGELVPQRADCVRGIGVVAKVTLDGLRGEAIEVDPGIEIGVGIVDPLCDTRNLHSFVALVDKAKSIQKVDRAP